LTKKIESITIEGFRGICRACIEDLTYLNIFVGKNNTGKSSLLEAIYLISCRDKHDVLGRIPLEYVVKRRE